MTERGLEVATGVVCSASTWQPATPPTASASRREVVERVAALVGRLDRRRLRIVIDGLTASGKSTFGHELAVVIARDGRQVLRACLDDFKRPWSESHLYDRVTGEGYFRNAFDYARCAELLLDPAADAGTGVVALCSIDPLTQLDHSTVTVSMSDDGVLIVDGVFALRPEINGNWDLRIWLDVDEDLSVHRGAARDAAIEGDLNAAETLHRTRYLPAESLYIHECDPISSADVVIDNRNFDDPQIIRLPE